MHPGAVGELTMRRALSHSQRRPARSTSPSHNRDVAVNVARRVLQLQRQAGNQAVVHLLQRDTGSHRENPPVTDLHPAGTWTTRHGLPPIALQSLPAPPTRSGHYFATSP